MQHLCLADQHLPEGQMQMSKLVKQKEHWMSIYGALRKKDEPKLKLTIWSGVQEKRTFESHWCSEEWLRALRWQPLRGL